MMHSLSVNDNIVCNSSAVNASISNSYDCYFADTNWINPILNISKNIKIIRYGTAENLPLYSKQNIVGFNLKVPDMGLFYNVIMFPGLPL